MTTPTTPERADEARQSSLEAERRRDALASSIALWVGTLTLAELQHVDAFVVGLLRDRCAWAKHAADRKWHAVREIAGGSVISRCNGRFSQRDEHAFDTRPLLADRCEACQDAYVAARVTELGAAAIKQAQRPTPTVEDGLRELRSALVVPTRPANDFAWSADADAPRGRR